MQFGCGTMDVHLYLSIEPVTLGSYIYTVMSFTSQLTTKLGKAFANSSVSPALNHLLSHMQATSEAWGAVVSWVYGWTSCMWPRAQTQSIICILFGQGRRQWKPTRKTFLYSGQEICHKPIIRWSISTFSLPLPSNGSICVLTQLGHYQWSAKCTYLRPACQQSCF